MRIKTRLKWVFFYLSLGMGAVSVADNGLFPGMEPLEDGVIDYVDLQADELVINDTAYELHDKTLVRRSTGAFTSLGSLPVGKAVRLYGDPALLEGVARPNYVKGIELR